MPYFFPATVYLLCFATSSACAWLLTRNYRRTGARLLLWSAICFLFLAANNLAVVVDLLVVPYRDFPRGETDAVLCRRRRSAVRVIWDLEEQ